MKRITRAVELKALSDLVAAPARAYVAYVAADRPQAVRVAARFDGERWLVKIPSQTLIADGSRVVLLIDDGDFYFELRGVRVRGTLRTAEDGWWDVIAEKIITWDYGSMREKIS